MSLSKEDKKEINDMIATGISAAIAAAKGENPEQAKQDVKPKTTFDERREMARKAKEKHDGAE